MHKKNGPVCIIGAGASGIAAAISAGRRGVPVTLVDRMPQIGRKILACGAGRCNLLNERLDASSYNESARALVASVLSRYSVATLRDFFADLGLAMYAEENRIFPVTNQSSSVLGVLALELKRLGIVPKNRFEAVAIVPGAEGFVVKGRAGMSVHCSNVIIASGGRSYPQLGSDGSGLALARALGHTIVEPVPAAVPVIVKDPLCHQLQGVRIPGRVTVSIDGKNRCSQDGDILFCAYGLSGTAVLDVSREVSVALHRNSGRQVSLIADMVPFMQPAALKSEITRRRERGVPEAEMLTGILPDKFSRAYQPMLRSGGLDLLVAGLKEKRFSVSGTRGWEEAEFTAGGVAAGEIDVRTMESLKQPGVYVCGEVLDVDGKRGGFNLAWAWASGLCAGLTGS